MSYGSYRSDDEFQTVCNSGGGMKLLDYLLSHPASDENENFSRNIVTSVTSITPEAPRTVEPAESIPHPIRPSCPAPARFAGYHSGGVTDGRKHRIHPPKSSREWKVWLRKWQPQGKVQ